MEMLICAIDTGKRAKLGDVICVCPDGWAWSPAEREHPGWAIVQIDITPIESEALGFSQPKAPRLNVENLPKTMTRAELYARLQ